MGPSVLISAGWYKNASGQCQSHDDQVEKQKK